MNKVCVIQVTHGSPRKSHLLKEMELSRVPTKDEKIILDDEKGIGQAYNVIDVHFADNNRTDVFVIHISTITELNVRLFGRDYS